MGTRLGQTVEQERRLRLAINTSREENIARAREQGQTNQVIRNIAQEVVSLRKHVANASNQVLAILIIIY